MPKDSKWKLKLTERLGKWAQKLQASPEPKADDSKKENVSCYGSQAQVWSLNF